MLPKGQTERNRSASNPKERVFRFWSVSWVVLERASDEERPHYLFHSMEDGAPAKPSPWKKVSQPASMPSSFKDLMREAEEKRKKEMLSGAL